MRVAELADRFGVPYRDVRYVLEQGHVPLGVEESPGRGEHRELSQAQAFWLAIVLLVKQNGIRAPVAAKVADHVVGAVNMIAKVMAWNSKLNTFSDPILTEYEWYADIGDLKYIRLVTDANSGNPRKIHEFPWTPIGKRQEVPDFQPLVMIRIDLARVAAKLA